jgi:hypothetical protein
MLRRLINRLRRLLARIRRRRSCAGCQAVRSGRIIREVTDPERLLDWLGQIRAAGSGALSAADYQVIEDELRTAREQRPGVPLFAHTPHTSLLQGKLTQCIASRAEHLVHDAPHGLHRIFHDLLADVAIFRKFGDCDPAFIETEIAQLLTHFHRRPPFPNRPAPPAALAEDARVILVGDWGTGLPGAVAVGRQMRAQLDRAGGRQCHVIHLGDVYYSGWREEYESRFLPFWPVASADEGTASWALNGNHDAYSGGHGYFGFLLRDERFRGHRVPGDGEYDTSSHFSLENEHWQVLGLDTGYLDHDLAGDQAAWVTGRLGGDRRTMLLTHHQPLSAYEQVGAQLGERLRPAADEHPIDAWFWGHEHRCAVYAESPASYLRFGSCVGHGGVPNLLPNPKPAASPRLTWAYGGKEDIEGNDWGLFGFAVLDFDGPAVSVSYIDEHGRVDHREELPG